MMMVMMLERLLITNMPLAAPQEDLQHPDQDSAAWRLDRGPRRKEPAPEMLLLHQDRPLAQWIGTTYSPICTGVGA